MKNRYSGQMKPVLRMIASVTALAIASLTVSTLTVACAQSQNDFIYYDYRVINAYPHDKDAFTQGLFFHDGILFESTGQLGKSSVRKVDLETGIILERTNLPDHIFGEGIALADDRIVTLTWRAKKGFVYDSKTLALTGEFTYDTEGWGITHDGTQFIMSDGSATLQMLDTKTLNVTGTLDITFRGKPISRLNELEWIDGEIFANVWQTNAILRIDPATGMVTSVIDLRGLLSDEDKTSQTNVLNGIAYDAASHRLFVTGKNWPKLFEIELVERTAEP